MKFPKNLASVEKLMSLIMVFIAFFALIGVSTACNCTDFNMDSGSRIGMANPAAVYCEDLGYEYKIITDSEGGQKGVCVFPDNTSCDAWEFFTGKCGQNYSYCKIHRCDIETVSDGKNPYSPEYAVCVLPNKTKMSVIKLMDLDKKILAGTIPLESKSINASDITRENKFFGVETPITFDWRKKDGKDWMTPVKDQGACGSCWAFSAVGIVEPQYNIFYDNPDFDPDLSEQYLVSDCCADCGDCGGGWLSTALEFIRYEGITDEACFPYIASDCPCSDRCSDWNNRLWKINYTAGPLPDDVETIKKYLIKKGPLSVAMKYDGYWDKDIYRCSDDYGVNHAVVIVGYNDIGGYWIVKNSWGSNWNDDGYFKVGYGECSIENYVYYANLAKNLSYCLASTNNADYEWIKRVELNGNEKNSGSSTYSNFTDEVLTTLKRGDTYTLQVEGHTTGGYKEFVKAWIDFNNDKDFIDAGEEIDLGNYTFDGNHTFSANFKVPEDAVLSDTRMRVYLKYADEPDPCENASYGEVEDYKVKISSPAVLTDNYSDYGIDTDGDGYYDYLAIDVGVNIRKAGDYRISGSLYNSSGWYIDSTTNYTTLNAGNQTVQLRFNGARIWQSRTNGTFDLRYLGLYNASDWSQLDYRYYAYTTKSYNYTDFKPPAEFGTVFIDYGLDTNSNELYDYLVVEKQINVATAGNYELDGYLVNNSGYWVDSDYNYTYLSAGIHNLTLKFSGYKIYNSKSTGNFTVHTDLYDYSTSALSASLGSEKIEKSFVENKSIIEPRLAEIKDANISSQNIEPLAVSSEQITTSTWRWLDSARDITRYYNYTQFEPPPALFNDQYSDYGEDTDGDGLYDYLVVEVGVNVAEAGNYRVSGYLYENGTYDSVDYDSNTTYLNPGNQTIQLRFEGIKLRNNEYNGTYDLKYLYLYDVAYHQLDYRYYAYTTSYYNYTEFQPPIPDAYEPDDNPLLANYISVDGTKQTHNFHVPGDQDWLKFNATSDISYIIETSDLGNESDTYLYLYDTDGTTEIEHDDDSGIGLASKIVWNCSISGTYYIMVRHWSSSAFGPETGYNISVTVKEAPPNIAWNMTISATNQLEPVVVGMHPNATDGYDADFDAFAQTPVQGKVILILDDIYSTSIKKTRCYNESVSWNLSVGVPTGETATLSWDAPPNVNLTITEGSNILYSGVELSEGSHELLVTAKLIESTTFSLKLEPGWNMVSLPLVPDNSSVYAVFGSIPTLDTMPVVTWEAPSFVVVEEIEPKIGYWVFTPSETTINVTGKPITNTTLILEAGWNMVGTAGMEDLTISDIPNQVPQRPAVTWVAPSFVKTDVIEPGKSAWVFVTTDTIVTMGKAVSGEMKVKAVPAIAKIKSVITPATTEEWNLTISATNQLEPVTLGIHPDATNEYDEYDVFAQTPVQGKVIMILDKIYATEINKDKLTWNFSVGVPAGQTTTLTWDSSKIPADVSLTLDGIDMKLQNSIELGEGSHSFVINGTTGEPTAIFDTGAPSNPYPSIAGTHTGDIIPSQDITVHKIYTYPCPGTGGHTEYVRIWNDTWGGKEAHWSGYQHDWHNITFDEPFTLFAKRTYHYEIITGSYPQIIHKPEHTTPDGSYINCTSFVDANGKTYTDWIPAIRIYTRYL